LIADLAEGVLALDEQIKQVDELIQGRFHRHPAAEVIISLPGMGVLLGAEFLAATGGDMAAYGTPDRLASLAGVAPVPATRGGWSATCTAPSATTGACSGCSTPRR
jgi:transposase